MKELIPLQQLREAYARREEPESMRRIAEAYWAILVILAGMVACVSIGYGIWQLLVPSDDAASTDVAAGIVGFNREQLLTLVEAFQKQQGDFEERMSR